MKNATGLQRLVPWGALLCALISAVLIVSSSRQQSLTIDEPDHLTCGIEWLQYGTYSTWPENPPLSRAAVAIGPYMRGFRIDPPKKEYANLWDQFLSSYQYNYFGQGDIVTNLFWIRIFILPFFLLSVWVVWIWSRSLGNEYTTLIAVGMYCFLPPIMAHSGLGTTDITFLSIFTLTLWFYSRWLTKPSNVNALWLGITMALCLVTKLSVLIFFPICAGVLGIAWLLFGLRQSGVESRHWLLQMLKSGVVVTVVTGMCLWAFYGFETGYLGDQVVIRTGVKSGVFDKSLSTLWLPAPSWFAGLELLFQHHKDGALVIVNGKLSLKGVWYFYALVSALKTPLPYMIVLIIGAAGAFRPNMPWSWQAVALVVLPFVILLMGFFSTINYGVRHILIVYPLGIIGASAGIFRLIQEPSRIASVVKRWILPLLVACEIFITIASFPDYLSYFNPLAGSEPGEYVSDSDLDWGQGAISLAKFSQENKIDTMWISYQGTFDTCWHPDMPVLKLLQRDSIVQGWIAVSDMHYRGVFHGGSAPRGNCTEYYFDFDPSKDLTPHRHFRWLDKYPVVGKVSGGAIRIYHVPKQNNVAVVNIEREKP